MSEQNPIPKNALKTYDRQLDTGRKLNRLRKYLRKRQKKDNVYLGEEKRRQMVEKISAEIVENLLTSKSDNELVREIKREMEENLGTSLFFFYPPNGEEMQILKSDPKEDQDMTDKERERVMRTLWVTTVRVVDRTML
ncbi:MAG: DVU0524 family FlgM-associated protein [Desulfonatronovibrionaceae bacterium]